MKEPVVFATYAFDAEQLQHTVLLTESIRTFSGRCRNAPVWIYVPGQLIKTQEKRICYLGSMNAEVRIAPVPSQATINMYYSGKVFAASAAEKRATDLTDLLVWVDEDTLFLKQPDALMIPDNTKFAYRPVMHNRTGVCWDADPGPFWHRIYTLLNITDSMMFPMVTPGDGVEIKPYFNAGLLAVQPKAQILQRWVSCYERLCNDPEIVNLCLANVDHRIFVHQAALTGAVLPFYSMSELCELPDTYNYPLFFNQMYDAQGAFENISNKVSIRYDAYFRNPARDWQDQLEGDPSIVEWLQKRLQPAPPRSNLR